MPKTRFIHAMLSRCLMRNFIYLASRGSFGRVRRTMLQVAVVCLTGLLLMGGVLPWRLPCSR